MKKVLLLDTSIGTSNLGDFIIMECVRKELNYILEKAFVYEMPTHLTAFNGLSVWKNSSTVQNYENANMKFAGGSNLLVKDLRTHYPQWNIHPWDSKPLRGVIMVGVGAGAGEYTNRYTTRLYQKVLNHDYYHSVRDERSKEYVESLGLKAINTGCVTMWMLTPEFCREIPQKKANRCVFTVTGRGADSPVREEEQRMFEILQRTYREIFFWIQGDKDLDYFNRMKNIRNVKVVPPSVEAYGALLNQDDLDYVGTRLHGGIYAMRHKKRAIIIAIDERAREINRANNLNCIELCEVSEKLEKMIHSSFATDIWMPFDRIAHWKDQFNRLV